MEEEDNMDEEAKKKKTPMTPWEQRAAVNSIPRFDFNAPSSLLRHSQSGFLITCTIICPDQDSADGAECGNSTNQYWNENGRHARANQFPAISLVKLTGSGLLLFRFPHEDSADTFHIVSHIIDFPGFGNSSSPQLNEPDLRTVVQTLVLKFMKDNPSRLAQPVKPRRNAMRTKKKKKNQRKLRDSEERKREKKKRITKNEAFLMNDVFDIICLAVHLLPSLCLSSLAPSVRAPQQKKPLSCHQ
ncbi:hypothetical protein ACJRO7_028145 [Eucalyptus globulus]|uniref:Uncharacterized protein n=1 Tax=Eucalyptus globulus TaxID=34317 RepID=A0ABD3JW18_EUCGL